MNPVSAELRRWCGRTLTVLACSATPVAHSEALNVPDASAAQPCGSGLILGVRPTWELPPARGPAFDRLLRTDPDRALDQACQLLHSAHTLPTQLEAQVHVAAAMAISSQGDLASQLLDAVSPKIPEGDPLAAEADYWRAYIRLDQRRDLEADTLLQAASKTLAGASMHRDVLDAKVLILQSRVSRIAGRLDEAQQRIDAADALLVQLGLTQSREAADVLAQRAELAFEHHDLPSTLRFGHTEYELRKRIGGPDDVELVDPLSTLGAVQSMTGDFAAAEASLQEGRRIAAKYGHRGIDAFLGLLSNLAAFYLDRSQPADAMPVAEQAVELAERRFGASSPQVFRLLLIQCTALENLGQYAQAAHVYERVAAIDEREADNLGRARRLRFLLGRATVFMRLNDRDLVRTSLDQADALLSNGPRLAYFQGWRERLSCKLAARDQDWPATESHCAAALPLLGESLPPGGALISEAVVGRCMAQASGALAGDACDEVQRRLDNGSLSNALVQVFALSALATRASAGGDATLALSLRIRALALAQAYGQPDPLWATQAELADTLHAAGERELAIFFGKLGVQSIEAMRGQFAADAARLERGFLSNKLAVYRHVADWLASDDRIPEALEVTGLLKDEEQFDFTRRDVPRAGNGVVMSAREAEMAETWNALAESHPSRAELAQLSRLSAAGKLTAAERLRRDRLQTEVAADTDRLVVAIQAFVASNRNPAGNARASTASARVSALLRAVPGTLFAVVLQNEDHVTLMLSANGVLTTRRLDIGSAALSVAVGRYLEAIARRGDLSGDLASSLYRTLGSPIDEVAASSGARRLVLILDGPMRYLPIDALFDGHRYLAEKYAIEYATLSSGQIAEAEGRPAIDRQHLRAFGVTKPLLGLSALPGVGRELCDIVKGPVVGLDGESDCARSGVGRGAFDGNAFANEQFTRERFQTLVDHAADAGFLHIGTHFALRPGNVERSWLLLGDSTKLSLDDMRRFDLKGVGLVTLSACQSAMGGGVTDDGQEIEGLPSTLHHRGAHQVLSSLWSVDDASTSVLMGAFYANLRQGTSAAQSLRRAQLQVLQHTSKDVDWRHPYFWAGFQLSTGLGFMSDVGQ